METEPSDSPPAAAAAGCPRWVMLNRHSHCTTSSAAAAAAETTSAASHTSIWELFRVSFRLAAPPACSIFYNDWAGSNGASVQGPEIVAAHGDCLLLNVTSPDPDKRYESAVTDYFLYEASAARSPALLLLPACFIPMVYERRRRRKEDPYYWSHNARYLWKDNTGILRRGKDEVVVAQIEVPSIEIPDGDAPEDVEPRKVRDEAELCVLRCTGSGSFKWDINRAVQIVHGESTASEGEELMRWWETDAAVPVGDRFLCFVDYYRGFLLCDMAADVADLRLRYVPLPVEPHEFNPFSVSDYGRPCMESYRSMAAASASAAVRFLTVDSRCCCGGPGESSCERAQFLFAVTTWTLSLTTDDEPTAAAWVKDGVLDCEELWAMPGYGSLPRTPVKFPIVSCDDADVVCFMVRDWYRSSSNREERKVWMLEINMRSKVLRSVVRYNSGEEEEGNQVPARIQCYQQFC